MHPFPKLVCAGLLALSSSLALASTSYNFSYTFQSGDSVTGSFNGDASGNLIDNLTDIHFSLNGTQVAGTIIGKSAPFGALAPVASFDGRQNQLFFSNSDYSRFFSSGEGSVEYGPPGTNVYLVLFDEGAGGGACDSITGQAAAPYSCGGLIGSTPRWSVSAVPEPDAFLMLGAGLAVLAWHRRRAPVKHGVPKLG